MLVEQRVQNPLNKSDTRCPRSAVPSPPALRGEMSRSDRATVLRINSVGAVGAQVAPVRVVFEHRAEDHEQRAHAGGERANTRVGQAASTDVGTTGREMLGTHSQHRFRSPHARPSQRLPPFSSFRHSHPCAIPAPSSPFLRPLRHSCGGRNPCDHPTVRRATIRPTAHQSPQRAAGDRAPSNIGSALDPTDRMDSCLRRNDGQAGVTEGAEE